MQTENNNLLIELTSDIAASYLSHNSVAIQDLQDVVSRIYESLVTISNEGAAAAGQAVPAVPAKKSVTPDYIICLEDGKKFKSLRRHLRTHYNLSPEQYRKKWGLEADYPMVAPNYAKARSRLAREMGLGNRNKRVET